MTDKYKLKRLKKIQEKNRCRKKKLQKYIRSVKFDKRPLPTMCDSVSCVTVHDEVKRKITKL